MPRSVGEGLASSGADLLRQESETVQLPTGSSMTKLLNLTKRFVADEGGAALIEYTVLIGVMLIAVIMAILAVGTWINNQWTALNSALTSAPAP